MTDTTQGEQTEVTEDSAEIIAEAKQFGWKAPSEWKGKPPEKGFMSAREWVDHSHKVLPLVERQLEKERERSGKLASDFESYKKQTAETVKGLERMSKVALDQQRRQIESEYAAKKEAAVEVGDTAKYRELVKNEKADVADLEKRLEPSEEERKAKTAEPTTLPKHIAEVVDGWKADNAWYGQDEDMTLIAERQHMRLNKEKSGLTLRQNLDAVTEYVKKRFPDKFETGEAEETEEDPKPRRSSAVEGGSRLNGSGGGRSLWSKVPTDARKLAEGAEHIQFFLQTGETMEKNAGAARERWAAKYFEGEQE